MILSQGEAAQSKTKRALATKIIFLGNIISRITMRQKILKEFTGRYSRYTWYIGTYHVYKRASQNARAKLGRLSYLTDQLRKYYPKGTKLYITKEYCEDGMPHYHFILGLEKDSWGRVVKLKSINNTKLWVKKWDLRESFVYHDEDDENDPNFNNNIPFYVNLQLEKLDMGARQRWFKYGVWRYLLYMFKYSNFKEYNDYFIMK